MGLCRLRCTRRARPAAASSGRLLPSSDMPTARVYDVYDRIRFVFSVFSCDSIPQQRSQTRIDRTPGLEITRTGRSRMVGCSAVWQVLQTRRLKAL